MWLVFGFAALGFLIGNLVGLTSEAVVSSTIGLLFAAIGGSVIVLLHKLPQTDRRLAGQLVFSLAVATLLGVGSGIYVSEHRILSPRLAAHTTTENKYLRSAFGSESASIDIQYNQHVINGDEAYKQLRKLVQSQLPE